MTSNQLIKELQKLEKDTIIWMSDGQSEYVQSVLRIEKHDGKIILEPAGDYEEVEY